MDGLALLKNDHDAVKDLFQRFEQGGTSNVFQVMFTQLYDALTLHTLIEEQVFYPLLRTLPETSSLIQHSYDEHAGAKETLTKVAALDNTSMEWGQLMTKLMHEITQHVEEEENSLFPKVRQVLNSDQLQQLGADLQRAKDRGLNSAVLNELQQQSASMKQSANMTRPKLDYDNANAQSDPNNALLDGDFQQS
jgi:hemerythrin superfamily protein